ncbi:Protein of unknown function [Fulvimarina manganoxydans]|uniref:DUF465 domain-containing protein n=1 Tax=Fulvimarina manganoxydans TaxID=937218 RepID=A0A1W2BAM0_9HYPH|nr:YdcH family protein [Fulvimarina manganoxydans]MCK5933313.1 YdcH family protein [Fulvimarina manganoxydans]MEE2951381.1 YdcH family protein [Pseudomonadota bacterium]SMC70037.1 Protein of unknown function [Fulvimarina manganoxydans]
MSRFLTALQARKAVIEQRIEDELRRPMPCSLRLGTLKKLKLQLRDQMQSLERLNRGSPIAV